MFASKFETWKRLSIKSSIEHCYDFVNVLQWFYLDSTHVTLCRHLRYNGAMYTLRPATQADYEFLFQLHRATMKEYIEAGSGNI